MALQMMDREDVRRGFRRWDQARRDRRKTARAERFRHYATPLVALLGWLVTLALLVARIAG